MTLPTKIKEYGTPDKDRTAYNLLMEHVKTMPVVSIIHHQRVPIDARACLLPQSLKVQAVLMYGAVVTCTQPAPGMPARIV